MPYNPGVSDISGQLLSQGILGAAQSLTSGFTQMARKQEEDKLLTAQSKATEGLLKSYLPADQADSILKVNPNETPAARHARLTGTIENFVIQNKLQEQQKAMSQQTTDQSALSKAISQFMPQGYGQQIQGGSGFSNLQSETAPSKFDPTRFMATYFQNGGSPRSLDQVDQVLKLYNPPYHAPQKTVDPASYKVTLANGRPGMKTVDQLSGDTLGSASIQDFPEVPNPLILEQYKDLAADRKDKVLPAVQASNAYDNIDSLLNSGDMITGKGANFELGLRKLATAFGGPSDPKVSTTELVRSQFAVPMFSMIKNLGSGSAISDADREFVGKAAGAEITLDATSIKRLAKIGKQASRETVQQYQDRLDSTFPGDTDNAQLKQARNSLKAPAFRPTAASEVAGIPPGIDPSLWAALTPQEKSLWQKK